VPKNSLVGHAFQLLLVSFFFLVMEAKKGISANQTTRSLKVSYEQAWYLCHRIRKSIEQVKIEPKFYGILEVDQTYMGGRYDMRHNSGSSDETSVIGPPQRSRTFEAQTTPAPSQQVLARIAKKWAAEEAKVYTNKYSVCKRLVKP
jgi:hypothetical protein